VLFKWTMTPEIRNVLQMFFLPISTCNAVNLDGQQSALLYMYALLCGTRFLFLSSEKQVHTGENILIISVLKCVFVIP